MPTDVVVDGVRSLVRENGPQTAQEAVVFVHGNPGSGEDWLDLLGRVGRFARAIAPDMPGFGKADRPANFDYTVQGYSRHLSGILDRLGVEHAHLVLHDFGGPWGLTWAAAHPTTVASVTLVNTGILPGYRWHRYARIWRTPILGELFLLTVTRPTFRWMVNRENPRPLPRSFLDRMYDDFDRGTKRAILKLYRATSDFDGMSDALTTRLVSRELPGQVLWGTGDTFVPARYAEEQRRLFGAAEVHLLDGCGHWPFIDDPEGVAALLIAFLRKQVGVPASAVDAR